MLDSRLEEFCGLIKPPAKYTEACCRTTAELLDLLVHKSSHPITGYMIGGGLPVAKNTSTCLKADSDVTVFVDWNKLEVTNAISSNIKLHKKQILDEWWKILSDFTPPDKPGDVIKRTPNSLHFMYQGVIIDILVAFQYHPDSKVHSQYHLKLLRVAHRLKKISHRQESVQATVKKLGSELTTSGVSWMRSKSSFVSDLARLAKFWSQTVVYNGCGNGKSFFFELVATKAALIEEERSQSKASHSKAFKRFLLMMINMKYLEIIFTDMYGMEEIPDDLKSESPLLLNPVNQFQNMFEVCEEKFMRTMSTAASVTLSKMRSKLTSQDFSAVFYPQNLVKLNHAICMRKACLTLQPPGPAHLMPTVVFNSAWMLPVLSAASNYQKIEFDPNGELRHLLSRALRLAASVVLCAEFSPLSSLSPLTDLQTFFKDLNCPSLERKSSSRDIQFNIFSKNLNCTISVGVDIVATFVDFD